jgi:hypothetical protein
MVERSVFDCGKEPDRSTNIFFGVLLTRMYPFNFVFEIRVSEHVEDLLHCPNLFEAVESRLFVKFGNWSP